MPCKIGQSAMHSICLCLIGAMFAAAIVPCKAAEPLRAGIIGTTTSHVPAFTKAINDPKATGPLADVKVVAGFTGGMRDNPSSWDRREKYTEFLREQGCTIYDSIEEMMKHVDVVLLESVDGRPHLEQARPVIAAGKPLFIDKPMAGSLADTLEIFRLAREANVPCFSSSSLRFSSGFQAARTGKSEFGKIESCTAWSPMSKEPHHPDLFWYGIHGTEILFTVMGPGCEKVTRTADNKVEGVWKDGRKGTFIGQKGYGAEVVGSKGSGNAGKYEGYKPLVVEICKFFKTGKPPVTEEETIEIYTFMEAADESKRRGGKTVSMAEVLKKAQAAAKQKPAVEKANIEKPNIIYIMTDDLGYGDLGCYGQKVIKTPNLDKLADEGMKLTDYYAGCTVCRPSRLVLWTGQHTGHTPISSNAGYIFKPEDVTVAELMKKAGYATGGVGKWAMGKAGSGGEPNRHGFDFWYGYLDQGEAHNYYPTHLYRCQGDKVEKAPLKGNVLMDDKNARGRVAQPEHRETYSHDEMTREALEFIRRNRDKPFLLHVHWTIPHANNEGGRVLKDGMEVPDYGIYKDKDWPSTEKGQAAMITRMDADVGRMIALLRELDIDKKTLVIFTSDNGPHSEGGHKHEYFDANGPLRGFKRDLYEGGIREPTIAWWPGKITAGTESAEPLAFYDFLPTACDVAGVEPPEKTDGVSFLPTLLGDTSGQMHHEYLYWKYGKKEAVRLGKWKAVRLSPDRPIELYDLDRDIGESTNVAEKNPDIVKRMKSILREASD